MLKRTQSTKPVKASQISRNWHLVDVSGKILGREATKIARILQGSHKPTFSANLDSGDFVVVVNAKSVKFSGRKEQEKTYENYSGYPGGRRVRSVPEMRKARPGEIVRHAVSGMLPKNKLRARRLARLFVFPEADHTYGDKFAKNS